MNGLRLSLIIIGIVIIGVIFLWDRRRRKNVRDDLEWSLPDPADEMKVDAFTSASDSDDLLPDEGIIAVQRNDEVDFERLQPMRGLREEEVRENDSKPPVTDEIPQQVEPSPPPTTERPPVKPQQESILVLSVIGTEGYKFDGTAIFKAAESAGLCYGEHKVFHLYPSADTEKKTAIFSMANILEPGNFDREKIASLKTPGMALFLQLPGPWDGAAAFERMVTTARTLAERLGGKLCDGRRKPVSDAQLDEMRQQAAGYRSEP
jgi:cell division protein ZipA